jgi:hypothetical protein
MLEGSMNQKICRNLLNYENLTDGDLERIHDESEPDLLSGKSRKRSILVCRKASLSESKAQ